MTYIPFLAKPQVKIVPVGNSAIGILYLEQKNDITPEENPTDFQSEQKEKAKSQKTLVAAISRNAKERGISYSAMQKIIFAQKVEKRAEPNTSETEIAVVDEADDSTSLFDYLNEDELEVMLSAQDRQRDVAIRAATFMVKQRVAYPVELTRDLVQNGTELHVSPINYPIGEGAHIKFGSFYLESAGNFPEGSEFLRVKPAIASIPAKTVGFMCEGDSTQVKIGYPEWTEEMTRKLLGERLIQAIYIFFQMETGALSDMDSVGEEAAVEPGESLKPSTNTSLPPSSNGETSFSGSNFSDAEMNGSTIEVLASSPGS